jgi:DNA-directed RNA polymerase sigma subunit (sigma70/sigma32)
LKNKERYLNLLDPIFLGDDDFKLNEFIDEKNNPSKISEYNNSLLELWISIKSELNLFSYKVFTYKYNIEFDKVMSDEKIAILMGCSEETIRKSLKETTKILKLKLNI